MQKLTRNDSTYESRVSFNTFDNKDATDISFTLSSKHKNFVETRRSRTFLCGMYSRRPPSKFSVKLGRFRLFQK